MKQITKKHFQLLEVLIALFLVVVCALPIIHSFVGIYLEQRHLQTDIERDHQLHLAHARLIEYLYQEGARGGSLKELMTEKDPQPIPGEPSEYLFLYTLKKDKPKNIKDSHKVLFDVTVIAKKADDKKNEEYSHAYKAFVKRIFKDGKDTF